MDNHPSVDIKSTLGTSLEGKIIVLAMTGSVAVAESPALARLLMRHGAEVYPVMTPSALKLMGADLMEWATGHRPITELTGKIEHVDLVGNVPRHADLILVAPATANTVGKAACGIDDTCVTTFMTTGIGEGVPVVLVPAMHLSMYQHPLVVKNLETLREIGVTILMPRLEEGKAKLASPDLILETVQTILSTGSPPAAASSAATSSPQLLKGKKVLITAGRTVEYLDPIRVITNNSSGKMGCALAKAARDQGAEVTLIYGKGTEAPPAGVQVFRVETSEDMLKQVEASLQASRRDIFLAAAAVGDWKPAQKAPQKISTHNGESLILELVPTPKILDRVRDLQGDIYLCAFRAQYQLTPEEFQKDALERLTKARANLIAANDTALPGVGFEKNTNQMTLWTDKGEKIELSLNSKENIAQKIVEFISQSLYY